jgi:hypothetical protein
MMMGWSDWASRFRRATAEQLFPDIIDDRVKAAVKVVDDRWWDQLQAGARSNDRSWHERSQDLDDALEAWRSNFLVRQLVRLTTAYVIGGGLTLRAREGAEKAESLNAFINEFWHHPQNRLDLRLYAMCDELTRSGELFPVLFPNPADHLAYLRFIPARQIINVETSPEDYERELAYLQSTFEAPVGGRRWAAGTSAGPGEPLMLHYAVNRPIGGVRGESDLLPVLPWARRYSEWLKDRIRFNRLRTEMACADITIEDDTQLSLKQAQYRANPPLQGGVFVHGRGEKVEFKSAAIQAWDAAPDGKAIRLAFAAGANIPLHFLAEGESANRATAAEMGGPTLRHYQQRQLYFAHILKDLVAAAYNMRAAASGEPPLSPDELTVQQPEIAREDTQALAGAAKTMVEALVAMKEQGWIDDSRAAALAFKFAGEMLKPEELQQILAEARRNAGPSPDS